jgi:cobalt-zinc-cadmium efflux system outer membrane protein
VESARADYEGDGLTLDEAVKTALAHNPGLVMAQWQVERARSVMIQAGLWANPQIEFSAEEVPANSGGLSRSKNLIGISQVVPFPGKKSLEREAAREGVQISELELRARHIELVAEVKRAFYAAIASEEQIEVSRQLAELATTFATTVRQRVEAGASRAQEQLRAEIEAERAWALLSSLSTDRAEVRQTLATLTGRPDLKDVPLLGKLRQSADFTPLKETQLLSRHPKNEAATTYIERAKLELKRRELDPLPDVTLGFSVGRNEADDEDLIEFRISLPLPLFDRGHGRSLDALASAEIARGNATKVKNEMIRELTLAEARLRDADRQVTAYSGRILPAADEALRMVEEGFKYGKFDFINVLDTRRTAFEARLGYVKKLLDLNVAQIELEALLSTEWLETE